MTSARSLILLILIGAACGPTPRSGDVGTDAPSCTTGTCEAECTVDEQCPDYAPVCTNGECVAACAGTDVAADFEALPSDIIFVVDQSGSMNQETAYVQTKLNDFAAQISVSNVDYHVIMIATPAGNNAICVPAPLGGPSCGNNTRFRLVDQRVDSHDGPQLAIDRFASYSDFLRPNATKHFVFITDDNSAMGAPAFRNAVLALPPAGSFAGFKVHGIYAYGSGPTGCSGPFGDGAAKGTVYTHLIADTGGAAGVICTGDWTAVLQDITAAVITGSISCEIAIPAPPMGETLDPSKVNVKYQTGGVTKTLPQVSSSAACTAAGGWYYDDNASPTTITLCPASCAIVQNDPAATLKVEFGCSTQLF